MSESIINYYTQIPKEYLSDSNYYNPNAKDGMPLHPFRIAIIGGMGSFKTNTAVNIIAGCACFERFYLIAKNLHQPLYSWLIDKYTELGNKMRCEIITYSENIADIPDLETLDKTKQNLIIIDDMINEKLEKNMKIKELFTRSRHYNCSAMFISQSYFAIPKQIRLNSNYFILKKINSKVDVREIVKNFQLDKTVDEIYKAYEKASTGVNFFLIDIDNPIPAMRYRMNFKTPVSFDGVENGKKSRKIV